MRLAIGDWDIRHMHTHLQAAANLEAWTIPYYLSAMLSIVEPQDEACPLIRSVANQEMLHLQLVGNIANAFGYRPLITPDIFVYEGTTIPHLDFDLDPSNPARRFSPYSAEIGPLDEQRINAMCLIEFPEWDTGGEPDYRDDVNEYGSIGEFYDALWHGAQQLESHIVGGVNQVYWFEEFYPELAPLVVRSDGKDGLDEMEQLMEVIRDQGEAATAQGDIPVPFRNTLDDPSPAQSHYQKFMDIRDRFLGGDGPEIYPVKDPSTYTSDDQDLLATLGRDFTAFTDEITNLIAGRTDELKLMETIGLDILACWKSGVTPRFTKPMASRRQGLRAAWAVPQPSA